jgi:hypothetical protein
MTAAAAAAAAAAATAAVVTAVLTAAAATFTCLGAVLHLHPLARAARAAEVHAPSCRRTTSGSIEAGEVRRYKETRFVGTRRGCPWGR